MNALIPVVTSLIYSSPNIIEILTQYWNYGNLITTFISNVVGNLNSTPYIEGELIVTSNNPSLSIYLDANGNLIIVSPDAANYAIDSNGELTYTS